MCSSRVKDLLNFHSDQTGDDTQNWLPTEMMIDEVWFGVQ